MLMNVSRLNRMLQLMKNEDSLKQGILKLLSGFLKIFLTTILTSQKGMGKMLRLLLIRQAALP